MSLRTPVIVDFFHLNILLHQTGSCSLHYLLSCLHRHHLSCGTFGRQLRLLCLHHHRHHALKHLWVEAGGISGSGWWGLGRLLHHGLHHEHHLLLECGVH